MFHWNTHYITDYIIQILIVDNGASMRPYRHLVAFLVETLALKLQGIDKDGLDLKFTIGNHYNIKEAKKEAPELFRKAVLKAMEAGREGQAEKTDMRHTLDELFWEYSRNKKKKRTTLLVVTDGIWDGPPPRNEKGELEACELEKKLVDFVKELRKIPSLEDRWFTIQFIQVGEDHDASERFIRLDDHLERNYKGFP